MFGTNGPRTHWCPTSGRTGRSAIAIRADVSQEGDVERLFREAERDLGPLAVLVNNAGIVDRKARVDEMHEPRLSE